MEFKLVNSFLQHRKRAFSTILLSLLFILFSHQTFGQIYPVTGSLSWIPPYTPVLGEIALPSTSQKFRLTLLLNDQVNQNAIVKLRFKIEGSGIRLQTNEGYQPAPINLSNGVPETFFGNDLSEYLRATALQFQGMTGDQYMRNASIPDGWYRISFQAFDYQRNQPMSDEIFINVFIATNEIPLSVFPACGEKLRINDPQYIMFSWINRAVNFSSTEFEFSLYWVQPKGRPPGDVAISSTPIFSTITDAPGFIYTSAEPVLIPGEEYVWRVQARDKNGLTLFRQDGFSQPCLFQWGDACEAPQNVKAEVQGSQRTTISWDESAAVVRYTLEYRPKNSESAQWYPIQTTNTSYTLSSQLNPSTSYEFRVKNTCGVNNSDYSPIDSFRTQDLFKNRTLSCGERNGIPLPDSTNKLISLRPGDKITMGGFTLTVATVTSGSNGKFSGTVVVPVNLINTSLQGNFSNLGINSAYQVYSGVVSINSGSIALLPPEIQTTVKGYLENINIIINSAGGGINTATSILNNGTTILNEIEKISETITGIDSTLSSTVGGYKEQFKALIDGISNGDSSNSAANFQNLWNKFVSVLNGGSSLQIGFDIKSIFLKQAKETRDSLNTENKSKDDDISLYDKIDQYNGFSIRELGSTENEEIDDNRIFITEEEDVSLETLKSDEGFAPLMETYEKEKDIIKRSIVIEQFINNLELLINNEDELTKFVTQAIREVDKFDLAKVDFANLDRAKIEVEAKKYLFNQLLQW